MEGGAGTQPPTGNGVKPPLLLPKMGKPPERHGRSRDVGVLGEQPRKTQVSPRVREGANWKFVGLWGLPRENPN